MQSLKSTLLFLVAIGQSCFVFAGDAFIEIGSHSQTVIIDGKNCEARALRYNTVYACFEKRKSASLRLGQLVFGLDYPVTEEQPEVVVARVLISEMSGIRESKWFELSRDLYSDVTEPIDFRVLSEGSKIVTHLRGSDGGGAFELNWVVDLKNLRARRQVISHAEIDDPTHGQWRPLKMINAPDVTETK